MTVPYTYVDAGKATVATGGGRIVGGASITLATGKGALFGSPSADAPLSLAVYRTSTFITILKCVGVTGDVLTIDGAWDDHADAAVLVGDEIYNGPTKKDMNDLWDWAKTPGPAGADGADGATGPTGATGATGPAGVGSFGISMPSGLSVSSSPLTSSGTIAVTTTLSGVLKGTGSGFAAAVAGTDYVSPSGLTTSLAPYALDSAAVHKTGNETIAGTKTFSTAIAGDVTGTAANVTGTVVATHGGTGLTSLGTANQVLGVNSGATGLEYKTITAGSGVTVTHGANTVTIAATGGGGSGTVTSVDLTMPGGLTVSGNPVTTSGTLAVSTALSGMIKAGGGNFSAAADGTDYISPTSLAGSLTSYALLASPTFSGTVTINDLTMHHDSGTDSTIVSTTATELVLEETGDAFGTMRLRLQNRSGSTGFLVEQAGLYPVLDISLATSSYQRNVRLETRSGVTFSGGPEVQILEPITGGVNLNFCVADGASCAFGSLLVAPTSDRATIVASPNPAKAMLEVRGGVMFKTDYTTSSVTLGNGQHSLGVDSSVGATTITLPSSTPRGQQFEVWDETGHAAANNITVSGTIDGGSSYVINTNYGVVRFRALGSNTFKIIGKV